MKKLSQSGELNDDVMLSIMSEIKKPERNEIRLTSDILEKYFPKNYTPQKMQEVIIKLLESWQKKRQMNIVENSSPEQSSPMITEPTEDFPVQDESAEDKAMLYKELNKSRTKESKDTLN